jgi:hypothetical protein
MAGVPLVWMVATYPVNVLLMIVVIFLFGWPWWRRVRFAVGPMVGNT